MVVFDNGRPTPSQYRRFKIRTVEGIDDYSMMQEMLRRGSPGWPVARRRRPRRWRGPTGPGRHNGSPLSGPTAGAWSPTWSLIDGGKGHLNAALEVMLDLGLADIPLASIAKREEEVFIPDMPDPIVLPRRSQGLYLIQRMRDEAHRFAITYHRNLRSKRSSRSALDDVPGVGPRRRKALIQRFGSVQAIREASTDDVASVVGITRSLAEKVKELL